MKTYDIYWIEEEIAACYFYKGEQLRRFFSEYRNSRHDSILDKQLLYITIPLPINQLMREIKQQCLYYTTNSTMYRELVLFGQDLEPIEVTLFDRQIRFKCDMLRHAEQALFPLLQDFEPFLFVTGVDHDDYGWMSPPFNFKLDYAK